MTLQSIGVKFFAKIRKGSCVFCYSSCIGFNPTSYLNNLFLQITNHLWLRPPWYIIHYNLFSFHGSSLVSRFSNQEIYYECVKVPMPTHQVLPLVLHIFEASYSTSVTRINKFRIWTNQNSEIYKQALEL